MASSAGGGGGGPTTGVITGTAAQDYQKKTTTPTLRADGVATLVEGDLWYDTTNDSLKVWDGAAWDAPAGGPTTGVITGTAAYDYQVAATAPTTRSVAGASGALVDGDQWFDTTANVLKTRKTGAWVAPAAGPTTGLISGTAAQDYQKGTTTPTLRAGGGALVEGDMWYDTTNDSLKVYDGAAWDAPAAPPTTGVITGTAAYDYQVAATAPTLRSGGGALVDGDLWFDTTANSFKTRKTGAWVSPAAGPTTGLITGTAAQDYQTAATAPTLRSGGGALVEGDMWYDTANDMLMVRSGVGTWIQTTGSGLSGSWIWLQGRLYGPPNTTINVSGTTASLTSSNVITVTTASYGYVVLPPAAPYNGFFNAAPHPDVPPYLDDAAVRMRCSVTPVFSLPAGTYTVAQKIAAIIGYMPHFYIW